MHTMRYKAGSTPKKVNYDYAYRGLDTEKMIECGLYIILKIADIDNPDDISKFKPVRYLKVLRLAYLADKTHLEQAGRTIYNDHYEITANGPVPVHLRSAMLVHNDVFKVTHSEHYVQALRSFDADHMSVSDTDALDQVIQCYAHLPEWHLRQLMLDDHAYRKAKKGKIPVREGKFFPYLAFIEHYDNGQDLWNYIHHLDDEE